MNMRFIDLHCDTLTVDSDNILQSWQGNINLDKLRRGGAWVQFFAMFIPTYAQASKVRGGPLPPYEFLQYFYDVYRREMSANAESIAPALCVADFEKNRAAGKISAVLTVEDAVPLEGKMDRLDEMYAYGVRLVTITWNYENSLGFPNSRDPEIMGRGLKPFGIDVVMRMNELGMAIDVSHLSDAGVRDVARYSSVPFVASHSCARALCEHPRCLSDDLLKLVADKGGVVGINFCPAFLNKDGDHTSMDDIVRHVLHIRNKAGLDTLALGSDFDGVPPNSLEFVDYAGMPDLAAGLEKYFNPDEMEKICSGNVLRVLREVWH